MLSFFTHSRQVLSDPEKRQLYDQVGKDGLEGGLDQTRQHADFFNSFVGRFSQPRVSYENNVIKIMLYKECYTKNVIRIMLYRLARG